VAAMAASMEAISFRPAGTSKPVPDVRHPGRDLLEAAPDFQGHA
jgi:hypothetical protein